MMLVFYLVCDRSIKWVGKSDKYILGIGHLEFSNKGCVLPRLSHLEPRF